MLLVITITKYNLKQSNVVCDHGLVGVESEPVSGSRWKVDGFVGHVKFSGAAFLWGVFGLRVDSLGFLDQGGEWLDQWICGPFWDIDPGLGGLALSQFFFKVAPIRIVATRY